MFNTYFQELIRGKDRLYHNYLGISKKEFPKWQGWKIIIDAKKLGTDVRTLQCRILDMHVRNFYHTQFLSQQFA